MADFSKRTEMTATFNRGDINNISVYKTQYSNNVTIQTNHNEQVMLKFADNTELKKFMEVMITLATKWTDTDSYFNEYVSLDSDDLITIETLQNWKSVQDTLDSLDTQDASNTPS